MQDRNEKNMIFFYIFQRFFRYILLALKKSLPFVVGYDAKENLQ